MLMSAGRPSDSSTDALKAEYLFLEAVNAQNADRYDDYYMLLRQAKRLAPDDPYIAASLAEIEIVMPTTDSVRLEKNYKALARRFYTEPTNERYAVAYSTIARQAGRIDDIIAIYRTQDSVSPDRSDPAFNLAAALAARFGMKGDTADLREALVLYNRLEKGLGHTLPVSARKINIFLATGDTADVMTELVALEKDAPSDVNTKLFAGGVYDHIGCRDSALIRYNLAEKLQPDNGTVYLARASFFREHGDSARYDTEVFKALESPTLDFEPKFQLLTDYVSKLYQDSLQWPRIDRMFSVMQEQNPGEAMLHELLASYKEATDKPAEAAEQLSYSIDLDPSVPGRWSDLVQLYFTLSDTVKVLSTAEKAMQLFPDEGYFPLAISMGMTMQGRDSEAIAMLDTLNINRYNNDRVCSAILATKGDILSRLGRTSDASSAYRQAIGLNPDNYMAMNNFAYFNACEGTELGAAELYAGIAIGAEPENPTYLDTYAWVLFKKGNYEKAKETIDKVLALSKAEGADPEVDIDEPSVEIYDHAGDIYYMSGLHDEAVDFWKMALELEPDNKLIQKKVRTKTYYAE